VEQQRRIHELESRNEEVREHTTEAAVPVQPVSAPVQEESRYEPPAPPPAPKVEEPRIDAKQLLNDSGLVMVETDRSRVQVQPPAVEEAQPMGRPRRERPKSPPQEDELVQIETRK
jgi:hypothetical protein